MAVNWTVVPAKNRRKLALFLGILVGVSLLSGWLFGPFWGLFAFVLLALSNLAFYTPTRYRLDESGITVYRPFYTLHRPWDWVARVEVDKNGVFLSPFAHPSRLDAFRGVYLLTHGQVEVEKVLAFIRERKGWKDESPIGSGR